MRHHSTVALRVVEGETGAPLAFAFGHTNASWTLKADLTFAYVCRLLTYMGLRRRARARSR